MPPSNSTASRYSGHPLVLKANVSAIPLYSPKCLEGRFLETRIHHPRWALAAPEAYTRREVLLDDSLFYAWRALWWRGWRTRAPGLARFCNSMTAF